MTDRYPIFDTSSSWSEKWANENDHHSTDDTCPLHDRKKTSVYLYCHMFICMKTDMTSAMEDLYTPDTSGVMTHSCLSDRDKTKSGESPFP